MLLLPGLAGCAARGAGGGFDAGAEPVVEFVALDLAGAARRSAERQDAVQVVLQVENPASRPIELFRVRVTLEGNIRARLQPEDERIRQEIPPGGRRLVPLRMLLLGAQSPLTSSGPLIPTLRGQLYFRTPRGRATLSIREQLEDFE